MKKYIHLPQSVSRTLDAPAGAPKQDSISQILQRYRKGIQPYPSLEENDFFGHKFPDRFSQIPSPQRTGILPDSSPIQCQLTTKADFFDKSTTFITSFKWKKHLSKIVNALKAYEQVNSPDEQEACLKKIVQACQKTTSNRYQRRITSLIEEVNAEIKNNLLPVLVNYSMGFSPTEATYQGVYNGNIYKFYSINDEEYHQAVDAQIISLKTVDQLFNEYAQANPPLGKDVTAYSKAFLKETSPKKITQEALQKIKNRFNTNDIVSVSNFTNTLEHPTFDITSSVGLLPSKICVFKPVKFEVIGGGTPTQVAAFKQQVLNAVTNILSNKFKVKVASIPPVSSHKSFPIEVEFKEDTGASFSISLNMGTHGRCICSANRCELFELGQGTETHIPDMTIAHECGHAILGLSDEYADSEYPARTVYIDNSLMGNYYTEGIGTAAIKIRHFGFLATHLGTLLPGKNISIIPF